MNCSSRPGWRRCAPQVLQALVVLLAVGVALSEAGTLSPEDAAQRRVEAERRRQQKRVYSLLDHIVRICIYTFISAVFAGLTLGVMCADTFTLEIIAESGPKPDCKYAATLLPLRRQGHKTLCTLIISNMLCNVLIVQEFSTLFDIVHALRVRGNASVVVDDSGSSLMNFIVSTAIIVIFAEIIPMSICKSKYSLRVAAAGTTFVWVAMVLTFPVSWPLGKFLDLVVGDEDAGQIYDKKELRKLMVLHYSRDDANASMAKSELDLLLSAMDFHDRTVKDIMTPIDKVFKVKETDLVTADFIERVWLSGRSRVPVESAEGHFRYVLVVKDLMSLSKGKELEEMTVEQLVRIKSRLFAVVGENTKLPSMMKFFQEAKTHMAVVIAEESTAASSGSPTSDVLLDTAASLAAPSSAGQQQPVVGIVTMEDVVEELLGDEIYDEYDRYDDTAPRDARVSSQFSDMPAEPETKPRVNFYSFFTHPEQDVPLSDAQLWSIVYFLNRTVPVFEAWAPGCIRMLLGECKDEQLVVPHSRRVSLAGRNPNGSAVDPLQDVQAGGAGGSDRADVTSNLSGSTTHGERLTALSLAHTTHSSFLSLAAEERFILYTKGTPTNYFTLVLGGEVDMVVGNDNFWTKLCTFNFIGEEALTKEFYIPGFSALVRKAARVVRIPRELYEKYAALQSYHRSSARRMRVLTSHPRSGGRRSGSRRREPIANSDGGVSDQLLESLSTPTASLTSRPRPSGYGTL